jgi:hypothetical protein
MKQIYLFALMGAMAGIMVVSCTKDDNAAADNGKTAGNSFVDCIDKGGTSAACLLSATDTSQFALKAGKPANDYTQAFYDALQNANPDNAAQIWEQIVASLDANKPDAAGDLTLSINVENSSRYSSQIDSVKIRGGYSVAYNNGIFTYSLSAPVESPQLSFPTGIATPADVKYSSFDALRGYKNGKLVVRINRASGEDGDDYIEAVEVYVYASKDAVLNGIDEDGDTYNNVQLKKGWNRTYVNVKWSGDNVTKITTSTTSATLKWFVGFYE